MRIGSFNIASGRDPSGRSVGGDELAAALAGLDVDVLALQEVDVDQPRSHGVHQPSVAAGALGASDWRFAPTLAGTPDPFASWARLDPVLDRGSLTGPHYGIALASRLPVRRWHVLHLDPARSSCRWSPPTRGPGRGGCGGSPTNRGPPSPPSSTGAPSSGPTCPSPRPPRRSSCAGCTAGRPASPAPSSSRVT